MDVFENLTRAYRLRSLLCFIDTSWIRRFSRGETMPMRCPEASSIWSSSSSSISVIWDVSYCFQCCSTRTTIDIIYQSSYLELIFDRFGRRDCRCLAGFLYWLNGRIVFRKNHSRWQHCLERLWWFLNMVKGFKPLGKQQQQMAYRWHRVFKITEDVGVNRTHVLVKQY